MQMISNEPQQTVVTADEFRRAMRKVASGVALVSASADGKPYGIAMTAFFSLSLEPPLMAIAVNRSSSLYSPLTQSGRFCVNVLADEQIELCQQFVRQAPANRFDNTNWSGFQSGVPTLRGAPSTITCRVSQSLTFGSHVVVIGEAEQITISENQEPLVFVDGSYGTFSKRPGF